MSKNLNFQPTNILAGPCPNCGNNTISYNINTGEAACEGITCYPNRDRVYCNFIGRVEQIGNRIRLVNLEVERLKKYIDETLIHHS